MDKKIEPVISIITPVLNEQDNIISYLNHLEKIIKINEITTEVIIVDASINNETIEMINNHSNNYDFKIKGIKYPVGQSPNRAGQMNLGVKNAKGNIFLFLHIDTLLPEPALMKINREINNGLNGGAFSISFYPANFKVKIVEFLDRMLIYFTKNFFGDQAIFTSRYFFEKTGGYPDVKLMEDLMMSDYLRKSKKFIIFKDKVITSSRRFLKNGIIKQMLLNTYLYNYFRLGGSTDKIYYKYEKIKKSNQK